MKRYFITLYCIFIFCPFFSINGQDIKGLILDNDSIPIPYATVVLMNEVDSTFIAGCVTDTNGLFKINNTKLIDISTTYINCKSLGYHPSNIRLNDSTTFYTLVLNYDNIHLEQVTIIGHKPIVKANVGSIQYSLANTPISKLGSLSDIIKNLPLVQSNDESYNIIGVGSPTFYINNRKLQDLSELKRIASEDVKDVEVIYNPGSEYSSDVKCVIRITTKSRIEDNWAVGILSKISYNPKINNEHIANFNYQFKRLSLFSAGSFIDKRITSKMNTKMSFIDNNNLYEPITKDFKESDYRNALFKFGAFFQHSPKLSFGAQYEYKDSPRNPLSKRDSYASSNSSSSQDSIYSYKSTHEGNTKSHHLNGNLDWLINKQNSIHIDLDYYKKRDYMNNSSIDKESGELVFLVSDNKANSQLIASNIWYNNISSIGSIKFGIESSSTKFKQDYYWQQEEDNHTKSSSDQIYFAPYISYNKNLSSFFINLGLRYELADYTYTIDDVKDRNISQIYRNLSPSFSIKYTQGKHVLNISYRTQITRPSYQMLNSTMSFVNPYAYQSGNPELKMTIGNIVDLVYSYSNFVLIKLNYSRQKDNSVYIFEKDKNKTIYYFKPHNINTSQYSTTLTFYKRLGRWIPNLSMGVYGQNISISNEKYNKPYFMLDLKNIFSLPRNWLINTNLLYRTKGNIQTSLIYNNYFANVSITKLLKSKWSLTIGVNNVFGSLKDDAKIYDNDVVFKKSDKPQGFIPYLTLKFNLNKIKKGTTQNKSYNSEINRL